ncbi:MAG TPA: response regulator [Micromonosporaceae bacterium]|nr:response regulator [Micromonosporaceae bacterium]
MSAKRVLLVEDEELNRVLVRAIIARTTDPTVRDIELVEAPSLASARNQLQTMDVDVILLDVNLPDGNGLTLASELAARVGALRPRVVALTASVLPHERAAAMTAGCDAFLDKPYAASQLVGVLAEQLHQAPPAPAGG